jgi:FAD/FMN-containing dehydrogenase
MALDANLIARFSAIVGTRNALTHDDEIAPYMKEWRGLYHGASSLVLRPGSKAEVSAILKLATETRTSIVPQGGNTGLVGGQIPDTSGTQIVLSLTRMNTIRSIDAASNAIIVDAGCTLQSVRDAADEVDRLFPLSLASQGSAQIGGNLSSNAGGTGALAYGVARDLCLGLEVVLPNGDILNGLRTLKKDNRGYDLRNLFIGAEGTLGIISAASLKLFPKPKGKATAWLGLASPEQALVMLNLMQDALGPSLTTFELCAATPMQFALIHNLQMRNPFAGNHKWYVLAEVSSGQSQAAVEHSLSSLLEAALEIEIIEDAVMAATIEQARAFWAIREAMSDAQKHEGGSIKHDISLPVAAIPEFIKRAGPIVEATIPGARVACFGHMGDGNLHYNVSQPIAADTQAYLAQWDELNRAVHGLVEEYHGSFSAEHGIGVLKRQLLAETLDPVMLTTMRGIKALLDPLNIMNPGKVL